MGVLVADSAQLTGLQRRLAAIPKSVRAAVQPTLQKSGQELVDTMKALAEPSRDTGDLIDSLVMTPGGESTPPYSQPGGSFVVPENAVAVTAGNSNVRYPHLVEYGTTKAKAQPFFWPAYRLLRKRLGSRIKRSIGKAVRDGWQHP
jgi:HK97 gp10 family phage protein